MNELQIKSLDIYKWFLMICENHNFSFFGIGGTCIGTVRHRGYIPWDDTDVAMSYPVFLSFIKVFEEEKSEDMSFFCNDLYMKMCDKETSFISMKGAQRYWH